MFSILFELQRIAHGPSYQSSVSTDQHGFTDKVPDKETGGKKTCLKS